MSVKTIVCAVLCGLWIGCASRPPLPAPIQPLCATPEPRAHAFSPPVVAQPSAAATIESTVLPNGLELWVLHREQLPYATLSLVTRTGTLHETCSPAVLHLTARDIVLGGTIWHDGRRVEPVRVNGYGIRYGVQTDHTHFDLSVLRESLADGMRVLARTLRHPALADDELEYQRLSELKHVQASLGGQLIMQLPLTGMYGKAVTSRLVHTDMEALRAVKSAEIAACYRDSLVPERSVLIAAGDVTLAELRALAEPLFGDWTSTSKKAAKALAAPPVQTERRTVYWLPLPRDAAQANIVLLQRAPASSAVQDLLPYELLTKIAVNDAMSRANTSLRHDTGLTYGLQTRRLQSSQLGILSISGEVETDSAAQAITGLLKLFEQLREQPITAAELAHAKLMLQAEWKQQLDNNLGLAAWARQLFAAGRPASWPDDLHTHLEAVTIADLQRVARAYLDPETAEIAVHASWLIERELDFIGRLERYRFTVEDR